MAAKDLLLGLLGQVDGLFLPHRIAGRLRAANSYFGRQDYLGRGLSFRSGGGDGAQRKAVERLLDNLVAAELVIICRRGRGLRWKFSDSGDALARNLVGLPDLLDSFIAVAELRRSSGKHPVGWWLRETAMSGIPYGATAAGEAATLLEDMLLPALVRGYAVSGADGQGHVSYAVTPSGRKWLEGPEPAAVKRAKPTDECRETYFEALRREQARLDHDPPDNTREIGPLRLCYSDPNG